MKKMLMVALAVFLAACGGEGGTLRSDLIAATAIVSVPGEGVIFEGRDISGDVLDPGTAQARIEIFRLEGEAVVWLQGAIAPNGDLILSRDPLAAGASGPLLDQASTLIAVVRPLITPTAGGVVFDAWFIALDAGGQVVVSDWEGAEHETLVKLLASGDDPLAILGAAVEALAARELGQSVDAEAPPLLEILDN